MVATASHARFRTRCGATSAPRSSAPRSRATCGCQRVPATASRCCSTILHRAARRHTVPSPRKCSPPTARTRRRRRPRAHRPAEIVRKKGSIMRRALGRGLETLLPGTPAPSTPATAMPTGVLTVRTTEITANPEQPRRRFDADALDALAESIRRHGLLQPLVVRREAHGYELIAGERRLRAAQRAGLEEVPVVVREATPPERLELALIENLQREDLTALEEAEAYRQLIEVYGLTQEEIAQRVGKSRPAIANALRLLSLPDSVKAQLESGELTPGHARAVLAVEGEESRVAFAREITSQKLPKSEAERLARARRTASDARQASTRRDPHWRALAEELTRGLGTRVRISRRNRGGTIEIEFYSEAELDRLLGHLRSGLTPERAF